ENEDDAGTVRIASGALSHALRTETEGIKGGPVGSVKAERLAGGCVELKVHVSGRSGVIVIGNPLLPARSTSADEAERRDEVLCSVGQNISEVSAAESNRLGAGVVEFEKVGANRR